MKSQQCAPQTITLDGYAASHRAVRELKADGSLPMDTKVRSSEYLNNLIEQDHRSLKRGSPLCLASSSFAMRRSRWPASSWCTESARNSSGYDVLAFKAKLRLQSGTQCSGPEGGTAQQGTVVLVLPICTRTVDGLFDPLLDVARQQAAPFFGAGLVTTSDPVVGFSRNAAISR